MSVTAIVVNFNAGAALQRCVQSLLDSSLRPRVLVVDNASLDDSARNLPALYGAAAGVETLFNPRNHGYAPALNAAARGVDPLDHNHATQELIRRLKSRLEQPTADGFGYRVDLDLRPEGRSGVLANSIKSASTRPPYWNTTSRSRKSKRH